VSFERVVSLAVGLAVGQIVYRQVVVAGMVLEGLSDHAHLCSCVHEHRVGLLNLSGRAYLCLVGPGSLALCRDSMAHEDLVHRECLYREDLGRQLSDRNNCRIDGLVP
jgi:hypothetical protein